MRKLVWIFGMLGIITSIQLQGQEEARLPAFPGAEGFGAYANGGRGGDVYMVTSLNDAGPGSLRHGIETADGPRTIVFGISGVIRLKSPLIVSKDSITIAGQTAPGDGICLRDNNFVVNADHVVVRYIRSRLGAAAGVEADAISIAGGHQVILDHCSASWSVDECFSCSTGRAGRIDSITVQWCMIAESLHNSIHRKGAHGYGSLVRGCYGASYSYHHNLFAHNYSRNPRPGNYDYNNHTRDPLGLLFDFRNNVIYNWGGQWPGYDADTGSVCRYNYVGNYVIPGADSELPGWVYNAGSPYFRAYYHDNYFNGTLPGDPWSLVRFGEGWTPVQIKAYKRSMPFPTGPVTTDAAPEAYEKVLAMGGASLVRDQVDARIVDGIRNRTGKLINSETEVGGWPDYKTGRALKDTDGDGMPDPWEIGNSLDPADPEDRNEDADGDGYTNLEEYLNGIVKPGS